MDRLYRFAYYISFPSCSIFHLIIFKYLLLYTSNSLPSQKSWLRYAYHKQRKDNKREVDEITWSYLCFVKAQLPYQLDLLWYKARQLMYIFVVKATGFISSYPIYFIFIFLVLGLGLTPAQLIQKVTIVTGGLVPYP